MKKNLLFMALLLAFASSAGPVARGFEATFDENFFPVNPVNTFGGFTFGGFGGSGLVDGVSSFFIDSSEYGGVGVDYVVDDGNGTGTFIPQDFDPTGHVVEISVKLLANNVAPNINVILSDVDGDGVADDHQYNFDLTSIPNDGNFHLLSRSVFDAGFVGNSFGFAKGDDVFNPGLRQIQIQSQFGSTDRLNVEVDFVQIRPIPEPTTLILAAFGCASIGIMTRRSTR